VRLPIEHIRRWREEAIDGHFPGCLLGPDDCYPCEVIKLCDALLELDGIEGVRAHSSFVFIRCPDDATANRIRNALKALKP
jgi:hypothetical protein